MPLLGDSEATCYMPMSIRLNLLLVFVCWLGSCAEHQTRPMASRLLGQSHEAIVQCSGQPQEELNTGHTKVFRYYREETMLDESRVASKGSIPGKHHGCWASVLVEDNRVVGVEFRPVPDESDSPYLCEMVFENCPQ
jgi:hypothetical protein